MSTRDEVNLTIREQQAFAMLEALAAADDPALARRLGSGPSAVASAGQALGRTCATHRWIGPACSAAGIGMMVGALASVGWLSVMGAGLLAVGLMVTGHSLAAASPHHR